VGANPVDRGKPGSKIHLVSERRGLPLTAANVNDIVLFEALLDDVPAVFTLARRRRGRRDKVDADKAYDHAANRAYLRRRGITSRIARRDRVVGPAGAAAVADRADAVVAVVIPAPGGPLGSWLGALVRVRAAGLCAGLL
jgi:hypothetical protein